MLETGQQCSTPDGVGVEVGELGGGAVQPRVAARRDGLGQPSHISKDWVSLH